MSPDNNLPDVLITLIIVGVILFVGIAAVSTTIEGSDASKSRVSQPALLDGTTPTVIGDTTGIDEKVYNSLGNAVELTGANDSYYQSTASIGAINDSTWTVSTFAQVDAAATNNTMTALSLGGDLILYYNGTTSNWTAWFYDDGPRTTHSVTVNAPAPTSTLQHLIVERDGDTLTIYRNNTAGESANLSQATPAAPPNTTNWDGTLEEMRSFDTALNASQRTQLRDNPIAPLPNTDRTARIMYDEPDSNTQLLFFTSGQIQLYNASIVDGFAGERMEGESFSNNLAGATDYRWDVDGPTIRAVDGGSLDGAPVAYTEYTSYGIVGGLVSDYQSALILAGLVLVILPLGAILTYLRDTSR